MRPVKRMIGIASLAVLLTVASSRASLATTTEVSAVELDRSSTVQVQRSSPSGQAQSYQEREARHPEAADFHGGDSVGIYIGGSAGLLVVVLLVILLLR